MEADFGRGRHTPAAQPQDGRAIGCLRLGEAEYIVEASAPQQRRLDALGPACGREQNHALDVPQVVDLPQELTENPLIDVVAGLFGAELGRNRVDGVEEKKAGRGAARLFEYFAQRALGVAEPLRVQLLAVDGDERDLLLSGER